MTLNILLPDYVNCDCVVFVDAYHVAAVVMMVMLPSPFDMVSLFMVVSLILVFVPPLVVT